MTVTGSGSEVREAYEGVQNECWPQGRLDWRPCGRLLAEGCFALLAELLGLALHAAPKRWTASAIEGGAATVRAALGS